MDMIDAALAFALTLAGLATVVTILMEIALKALGLRQKDQVKLIKRLYGEVIAPKVGGLVVDSKSKETVVDVVKQWEVVRKVLQNPMAKSEMAETESQQGFACQRCACIYDDISLEHLLRRVVDVKEIAEAFEEKEYELRQMLNEASQKYDEYRSAIATSFKSNARFWSVMVGIGLAFVMNVDGLRLFQAYLQNPELAAEVIKELEPRLDEVEETVSASTQDQGSADDATQVSLEELQTKMDELQSELAVIGDFDLPIGQHYFPACFYGDWVDRLVSYFKSLRGGQVEAVATVGGGEPDGGEKSRDPLCNGTQPPNFGDYATWILKVLVTGILIGLGAPFWYDVARRLAEVRRAFGGRGGAAQRHRGADPSQASGPAEGGETREDLAARVAREAGKAS